MHEGSTYDKPAPVEPVEKKELEEEAKLGLKPFNPRKRVNRPRKDRAAEDAQNSSELEEYNKGG